MSDHPVIDSLEASRPANSGRRMSFGGSIVLDQVVREANANNHNHSQPDHPQNGSAASLSPRARSPLTAPAPSSTASSSSLPPASPSTTDATETKTAAATNATVTSPRPGLPTNEGWQPFLNKSSNRVHPTQRVAAAEQLAYELADQRSVNHLVEEENQKYQQHQHPQQQHAHEKPSVLPKILPGLQERLADVHQASLKSVASVPTASDNGASVATGNGHSPAAAWTGGTMFPVSPVMGGASHGRHHHLAKNSILYESADVPLLGEENDQGPWTMTPQQQQLLQQQLMQQQQQQQHQHSSNTLVQGGSGNRRWSHELSPEKAGLVGSVLEAAGLIKDVVLDKVIHHGPGSTIESSEDSNILFSGGEPMVVPAAADKANSNNGSSAHKLTEQDRQAAARAAFGGGSDEMGDQNVYYSGLKTTEAAPASPNTTTTTTTTTTATTAPPGYGVQDLLASAPQAGQAHHKSMFVLHEAASNPEVYKGLLLHHPEKLGYHSHDPDWVGPVATEDPVLARLGVRGGSGVSGGHSIAAPPTAAGSELMTNADDRREHQK
ncbi:hypothetical protein BGZ73_008395 [Actinomortierella ambigua]|nr:hypothetical protein BGZ73_008395 [Actinomortierella ambigua]